MHLVKLNHSDPKLLENKAENSEVIKLESTLHKTELYFPII